MIKHHITHRVAATANRLLKVADLQINRTDTLGRSWDTVLDHLVDLGFEPDLVIDVGAAHGTPPLYGKFPEARHIWFEPLREYHDGLRERGQHLDVTIVEAAVTSQPGTMTINVHDDLIGSSAYKETSGAGDGVERTVTATTLDEHLKDDGATDILLKLDIQGAELDALNGAVEVLPRCRVLILECSLIATLEGVPELHEVLDYLHERGFVAYDVFGGLQRPLDGALSQLDLVFLKADDPWRADKRWQR